MLRFVPKISSSLPLLLICFLSSYPQVVDSQVDYECQLKSPVADFVTSYTLCMDSDPVPSIFDGIETGMNFFINAAQTENGIYFRDLGGGHIVIGDGVYQSSLYVYLKEDDESDDGTYTHGAIMVDAPKNYGEEFGNVVKEYLETNHNAQLTTFLATHAHIDHIGNWYKVAETNPSMTYHIASKAISEFLFKYQNPDYSIRKVQDILGAKAHEFPNFDVNEEITEPTELTFGKAGSDEQIKLQVRPLKGHQDGNLLIYHEASKTLTHIDSLAFPKWSPFFESAQKTDLPALFETFDVFREYDYDYFIGGHVTHLGTPEDVATSEKYFIDILDAAYRVVQPGIDRNAYVNAFEIAGEMGVFDGEDNDFGNLWLLFGEYFNRARVSCAKIVLNPKHNYSGINWITTLGAVRVTLLSHCDDAIESVRIDAPGEP